MEKDNPSFVFTAADMEARCARIADPAKPLDTKYEAAQELKEMIDTVRDSDGPRVFPHMLQMLLDILRGSEPSFKRDSAEYNFRKVLVEIIHRIPASESMRPHVSNMINVQLSIVRNDNEENGGTALKILNDSIRTMKQVTDEQVMELASIFEQLLKNLPEVVADLFSESSQAWDPNVVPHSIKSLKVLAEISLVMMWLVSQKPSAAAIAPSMAKILCAVMDALDVESPIQKATRENFEAMGGRWAGEAPGMKNGKLYESLILAQVKLLHFCAYTAQKGQSMMTDQEQRRQKLPEICVRLLQDCPFHLTNARKDIIHAVRQQFSSPFKNGFLAVFEKLLDEKIIVGSSTLPPDTSRYGPFLTTLELIAGLRAEFKPDQLALIMQILGKWMLNAQMGGQGQSLCARMIMALLEPCIVKLEHEEAVNVCNMSFRMAAEKLKSIETNVRHIYYRRRRTDKKDDVDGKALYIEEDRPVPSSHAILETESSSGEVRTLFRAVLLASRMTVTAMKKINTPVPGGEIISDVFRHCISIWSNFEASELNDDRETMETFSNLLQEINLHTFREVWSEQLDFFFKALVKQPNLIQLTSILFASKPISQTIVSVTLKYLSEQLETLGSCDENVASAILRLFKNVCNIVAIHPDAVEPVLASHLGRLIMDSFPLAGKSQKPIYYYQLMRILFRAIGSGAGRYDKLYKEVLPLLPEMLDCLTRQLMAAEGQTRELLVELCLTVPLRLTDLLPHLHYLMKPLVMALQGGAELVSQGLRTLELCIDNLISDFLDPILRPVLRDLMEALHSHLKPLPGNHHHAHTTIRILGKLGGRNRRLLDEKSSLSYIPYSDPAALAVAFFGRTETIEVSHVAQVAREMLAKQDSADHVHAYNYLEHTITYLLNEGVKNIDSETQVVKGVEALFDAVHLPDVQARALEYLRTLSRHVLTLEAQRILTTDAVKRRYPSQIFGLFLDALPSAMVRSDDQQAARGAEIVKELVHDIIPIASAQGLKHPDVLPIVHQIASRFTAFCFEDEWKKQHAGYTGIMITASIPEIGHKFLVAREIDIVRTFIHILKESPHDPPRSVLKVKEDLLGILRRTNSAYGDQMDIDGEAAQHRSRLPYLASMLFSEIGCAHPGVRQTIQECIQLLSELYGKTVPELGRLVRDRLHATLYVKPLRTLNHNLVIGIVDGVRYLIGFSPSILEEDEHLIRLLSESIGLAENADIANVKTDIRKNSLEVTQLRVACLKLLTNALVLTDNFARHPPPRQRVTQIYFKSLYNPSKEVADAAHEGLRIILSDQNRFPKESLQQGLRPILMNLSDTKKLTIQDLDGLSRLLMLLANYFKVEIGQKLLEHFRTIAEPQVLLNAARMPLSDNDAINKLVRLVNVYHLLPSTASVYLRDLVEVVVQTEAVLMSCSRSPFSEPLAKYLDRNAPEAAEYFINCLISPPHIRTLRNLLSENLAPKLLAELGSRTQQIARIAFKSGNTELIVPGLRLCKDLSQLINGWVTSDDIIEPVRDLWRNEQFNPSDWGRYPERVFQMYELILWIFMQVLRETPRIDLIMDVILLYTGNIPVDRSHVSHFLYGHVAQNKSLQFRRNILLRFQIWFGDSSVSWSTKTALLRYVVSPMIFVHTGQASEESIFDKSIVEWFHQKIWVANEQGAFASSDDLFKIELLHLTTILIRQAPQLFSGAKKDLIKFVWVYIMSEDQTVKQVASLLAAQFFAAYDSPAKFIMRTWTGLLQPPHIEGNRTLVRQALDILAPVLRTMPPEKNVPHWSRTTRKLLAEEGSGIMQTIVIYQLIMRHPDLFYPYRALFIPHIINSLHRLGPSLNPAPAAEGQIISIDILEVIRKWEDKMRLVREGTAMDEDGPADETPDWVTPLHYREAVISFLTRACCSLQESNARTIGVGRALTLMRNFLRLPAWPDVNFKLDYFRKVMCETEYAKETVPIILATSRVLNVVCTDRPDSWFLQNGSILQKLIQKGMTSEDPVLHDTLYPIVDRLLALYPLPKEDEESSHPEMAEFHSFVHDTITEYLKSPSGIRSSILMLKSVAQHSPERIELYAPALMKLLSKLTRDHVAASDNRSVEYEGTVRLIIMTLKICQNAASFASEQRRTYLASLMLLVEKSTSPHLCQFLLDMARDWALTKRDAYPTMKEKAILLLKMATFETRGIELFNQFLELIYDIYSQTSLRRSELTSRLEPAFMLGCRSVDTSLRERFMDLLDSSIPRSLMSRLTYILAVQSWDSLSDHNWIYLALDLLLSSIDAELPLTSSPNVLFAQTSSPMAQSIASSTLRDVVRPMRRLLFYDVQAAQSTWKSVFSAVWSLLSRKEQGEVASHMVVLLSRDYHIRQSELRPNVIQGLLEGIHACKPTMSLPAHLIKYLAKTFCCWHVALEYLQKSLDSVRDEDVSMRDSTNDALAELYAEIAEEDMFYGLWRRRSLHHETNVAITYEQNGMWPEAQIAYEQAQTKARDTVISFSEAEYCLWEDHWITATEKMQQWDILYELARNDGNNELFLEAAWRSKDWADKESLSIMEDQLAQMSSVATPRRRVYEAFIALVKSPGAVDKNIEFTRILEDAMQLSLRKWIAFPVKMSSCHIPLLQHFQQFVELQEAVQIFGSLASTNGQNIERKSADLKLVLQAWRERLPNLHDDISVWSDLIAWRQNVFSSINKSYIPIINASAQNNTPNTANTYGYRGYHETAWIINRFAHVARKHDLFEVAQQSLTKIYELPNIEISEAFLKLREEARCRLQVPERLVDGLNLINNTNLIYFSTPQKAEFYTLKAMFYSALGQNDEADNCFSQAVQLDMNVAKAWAEWGRFNDKLFTSSNDTKHAAHAVTCYLQAAGLYKNAKSRPLLTRVLWLLSNDDGAGNVGLSFTTFTGERAFWYWIHLVPQLLFSLSFQEGQHAIKLLLELAKLHPQGVFFPLRTLREDHTMLKKQTDLTRQAKLQQGIDPEIANAEMMELFKRPETKYVDDLVAQVKTNNPVLALTLENTVEQFTNKFRATPEEEIYRFTFMLLQDAVQNASSRACNLADDGTLSEHLQKNIQRLGSHLQGDAKRDFEEDFMAHRPILSEYISRLQHWRDRYERYLDARPRVQSLDLISHWLMEFQFVKLDEIDVPGQYLELVDGPQQFSRIRRFGPKFEICRGQGYCFKRIVIHGHDGIKFDFAVQLPVARWIRREDRVMQLLRTFNLALTRRKESRKRNLQFHLPLAVSITPQIRLLANDSSYVTLQDVYDRHCLDKGITREDPVLQIAQKTREILEERGSQPPRDEHNAIRKAIIDEVCKKLVPDDVLNRYMARTMNGPQELWRMRKSFTLQLAAASFLTFAFQITQRQPSRFQISRTTGQLFMSELLCGFNGSNGLLMTTESVPFRLTPNLQQLVGPIGTEALLCPGIVAIARALTKPEYDLDQHLCLFIRDEVLTTLNMRGPRNPEIEVRFRQIVQANINGIVNRADTMACKLEKGQDPKDNKIVQSMQSVTNLISASTNPTKLAMMPDNFHSWF